MKGSILDKRGLEQGTILSDRIYKLYNNSQLEDAQNSDLGVMIYDTAVAAIGQADDCALITNSPVNLCGLLYLNSLYCKRQHVQLVPEKTKLLVWSPQSQKLKTNLQQLGCPISVDGHAISYASFGKHVGIRRSVEGGNMPHIIDRISAHSRATASILHTGAAVHHSANPSASIQLEQLYDCPVLFSGVASLVLSKKEIKVLSKHHKRTLCRLKKLPSNTPDCVVHFLAGSLPAVGILHLWILSLLCMIARSSSSSILQ